MAASEGTALVSGRSCPISISIGTHPMELMGAGFRAPIGVDELAIAGGIRGALVALAQCETIDLPYPRGHRQAIVRHKGYPPPSLTFASHAELRSARVRLGPDRRSTYRDRSPPERTTLAEAVGRYLAEVTVGTGNGCCVRGCSGTRCK